LPARRKPRILTVAVILLVITAACLASAPRPQTSHDSQPIRSSALLEPSWTAESDQVGANFGYSVSSAGDVNNDGYDDVIVGANNFDNGETDEGRAMLYLGSSSGLSATPSWTTESNQAYARLGYSVSSAGDVNGDGYDDVLVGAYVYDNGETDEGRAYLFQGSATGLSASPLWSAEGNQASAYFGSSVASAGDVNKDGYDDVLVASLFYSNGNSSEGRVYLYQGSSSGLSASPSWISEGNQSYAWFGRSVASAGDVNNDGYDDVIVGAYYYDNGEINEGSAFLYLGSSSGLSASHSWMGESNQKDAWFGYSVSSAGDVNHDGFADVIVGAVGYDNPDYYEGRAYVYLGSSSGLPASPSWTNEGNQANAYYGVVSSAGDVNGDGYSDIVVGAHFYDNDTVDEGRACLYLGSSSGPSSSASWTAESDQFYTMFGSSLGRAGDVNGDGADDIVIGAYSYNNGEDDEGRAYVYSGFSSQQPVEFTINLVAGWNLVSVPLVSHGYKASTLGLPAGSQAISWDPPFEIYKTHIVGLPLNDFDILPSTGYWIYVSTAKTLTLSGMAPTAEQSKAIMVPAGGGWVLVGMCSMNTGWKAADLASMFTGSSLTTVVMWNAAAQSYTTYIVGLPLNNFSLVPGQGYWIYVSGSGTLTYIP
jgi:hypothetical protein